MARTELPQQGQIYFLVLDGRGGGGVVPVPLCVPVLVIWNPANSLRLMRMSVKTVLQYEVQQFVRGALWSPPVFVAMLHYQAVGFGGGFEAAIVVGVAPAAILYAVLIV